MDVEGHDVTIEVYRARGPGPSYHGFWKCPSISFCQGGSGHYDDDIEQVIIANRVNAHGGVMGRIDEAKRQSQKEDNEQGETHRPG